MWDFRCGVYTAAHAEKVSVMLNCKTCTLFPPIWVNSKQELQYSPKFWIHSVAVMILIEPTLESIAFRMNALCYSIRTLTSRLLSIISLFVLVSVSLQQSVTVTVNQHFAFHSLNASTLSNCILIKLVMNGHTIQQWYNMSVMHNHMKVN